MNNLDIKNPEWQDLEYKATYQLFEMGETLDRSC